MSMKIKSLKQLAKAAMDRKSVFMPGNSMAGVMPAAFLMNMQGWTIHWRLRAGLEIYTPKSNRPKWKQK